MWTIALFRTLGLGRWTTCSRSHRGNWTRSGVQMYLNGILCLNSSLCYLLGGGFERLLGFLVLLQELFPWSSSCYLVAASETRFLACWLLCSQIAAFSSWRNRVQVPPTTDHSKHQEINEDANASSAIYPALSEMWEVNLTLNWWFRNFTGTDVCRRTQTHFLLALETRFQMVEVDE